MDDVQVAVVVGGGASGALASVELLANGWSVVLVDPQAQAGRGVAYSTTSSWHLLNSPVGTMSAFSDRPADFLRWCQLRSPDTQPSDFVPRSWYGDYLSDTLRAADSGRLTVHRASVSRVFEATAGGYAVLLSDGVMIPAAQVVLALGNSAPSEPIPLSAEVRRARSYVADPWRAGDPSGCDDGPVLLLGTGLTAYDVVLSLVRAKPGVQITAVSRHGLTPQPHRRSSPLPTTPNVGGSLAEILHRLRTSAGEWRAVMDAHRPHWNALWNGLSEADQHRFLHHAARWWEVHRHRVAPAIADEIAALRADGTLRVHAGEVRRIEVDPAGGLNVTLRGVTQHFSTVINCTGPGRIVDSSPLVRAMIAEGMARPGPHQLGLDTDAHGALVRRDGSVSGSLWTLGPPRRGVLWETTAVPEIRAQARALAQQLTRAGVA